MDELEIKLESKHPSYLEMAIVAITALKDRAGSSIIAIQKYINNNYYVNIDDKRMRRYIYDALKSGINKGLIIQEKRSYRCVKK